MFRNLLIASTANKQQPSIYPLRDEPVNTATPYADETLTPFTPDERFIIVGANTIDGDVRAGVYSVLDKQTLTLVSGRKASDITVSGGYTIDWTVNSQNLSCTIGEHSERMWLNILRNIQGRDIRISATINGNGITDKTIYFDVNCTYAPANFIIRNIDDWLLLKTAIDEGQESYYYLNATTGCANKRFRLACDLVFDYNSANYSIGRYNVDTRGGVYFAGVFDGADYVISISGTLPYTASRDRNAGAFAYVYNARILNLNVKGSVNAGQAAAGIIGAHRMSCHFERLYSNCIIETSSGAGGGIEGAAYALAARQSETIAIPDFAPIVKDLCFVGKVTAYAHTGMISHDCCKNATRLIAIGSAKSLQTANPVKSGITLDDGDRVGEQNFFIDSMFSKAKLSNGQEQSRGCIQIQGYIGKAIVRNILSMNEATAACIISHHHTVSPTMSDLYCTKDSSTSNTTWIKVKGTKKTFAQACSADLFNANANWIKGSVGTNIINNQYATNPHVLMAAKIEGYYGEEIIDYMRMVPETSGTITFTKKNNATGSLYYKKGYADSWSEVSSGVAVSVNANDIIYFKGDLKPATASFSAAITIDENYGIGTFSSTCDFAVGGNIMSLLYGDDIAGKTSLADYSAPFHALFARSRVKHAEDLILPATTLSANCYANMFNLCEYLLDAPALPADIAPLGAYYSMFKSCYRLEEMPDVDCTTISGKAGMSQMFRFSGLRKFDKCKVTTITNNADYALSMICTNCEELEEVVVPNITTVANYTFNSAFAYCVKTSYYRTSVVPYSSDVRSGFKSDCQFVDKNGNYITLGNNITCDDFVGLKKVTFPDDFRASIGNYELQYMFTGDKALKEIRCKSAINNSSSRPKWLGYLGHTTINGESRTTKGTFTTGVNASWGGGVEGYNSSAFTLNQIID